MNVVAEFDGEYAWLSNFWQGAPLVYLGQQWKTLEHAFQAAKTDDEVWKRRIQHAATPARAKALGRQAPRRPDWDVARVQVMDALVRIKFKDPELRAKLLATGDAMLIEGNTWGDTFWGVCKGRGRNMLGRSIMQTRASIVAEERRG